MNRSTRRRERRRAVPWGTWTALACNLWLASFAGLHTSEDDGATWREWCTLLPDYVRAVGISPGHPDDPRLWIGSSGAGLGESRDGGTTWSVTSLPNSYVEEANPAPQFPVDPLLFLIADRDLLRSAAGALFPLAQDGGVTILAVTRGEDVWRSRGAGEWSELDSLPSRISQGVVLGGPTAPP